MTTFFAKLFGKGNESQHKSNEIKVNESPDLNGKDDNGMTALMYAAKSGDTKTVKTLLDKGADVNAKEGRNNSGMTALLHAATEDHTEIIEILLDKGADYDRLLYDAALIHAATGRPELANMLLEKGASGNAKDKEGYAALLKQSRDGFAEMRAIYAKTLGKL